MTQKQREYEQEQKAKREKIEYMRQEVQELELQARYWKANYETKQYTLLDKGIKVEYDEFMRKTREEYIQHLTEEKAKYDKEQEEAALAELETNKFDSIINETYSITSEEAPQ